MTEILLFVGYSLCAAAFLALELVGKFGFHPSDTVSANLRALQQQHGWKVRLPLLLGWAVLGTHIFLGLP